MYYLCLLLASLHCFNGYTHEDEMKKRLDHCPSSPNCVCSHDKDRRSYIEAFPWQSGGLEKLKLLILKLPRTKLIEEEKDYLHFEFRSKWLRFVDDVEFLLDSESNVIQVRSASRIGYSDLGANRSRIEKLRKLYGQQL